MNKLIVGSFFVGLTVYHGLGVSGVGEDFLANFLYSVDIIPGCQKN